MYHTVLGIIDTILKTSPGAISIIPVREDYNIIGKPIKKFFFLVQDRENPGENGPFSNIGVSHFFKFIKFIWLESH